MRGMQVHGSGWRSGWQVLVLGTALLWATAFGASVKADVDSVSVLPGGTHVIDFSRFMGDVFFTNGPVDLGQGVTWTASHEGMLGDMAFGLRANGYWDAGQQGYAALDAPDASMLFVFDRDYYWVTAFANYAPFREGDPIPTLIAYDADWNVIDIDAQVVRTPNGVNEGGTLMVEAEFPQIRAVRFSARYGVIDDFVFGEFAPPQNLRTPKPIWVRGPGFIMPVQPGK